MTEVSSLLSTWQKLAQQGDWEALYCATANVDDLHTVIPAALWQSRALRALSRGAEANAAVLAVAKGRFEAAVEQVAELAEELVQCAYYDAAAQLATRLQAVNVPQADYLWSWLWREREDWLKFEAAVAKLSSHPEPWSSLATIQQVWADLRQDRLAVADSRLKPLADHPHPGIQKLAARLDLASGRHESARMRLEQVAKSQPLDWEWPCLLAVAGTALISSIDGHERESLIKRVLALYDQGLIRQPRQPEMLFNRAKMRQALGDINGAEQDARLALDIKPWFDAPVLFWVEQAVATHDYDRAELVLAKARLQLDTPRRAAAWLDLLRLKGGSKDTALIKEAETVLSHFPADAAALRSIGAAFQTARKPDRAAALYARALNRMPDDLGIRNNLAILYRDRGDLEEAINTWRVALPQADDRIKLNYALVLLDRGDRIEAENIFRDVLSRQPQNAIALRGMAEIFYQAGEDDKAWDYARASLQYDPKHPRAWRTVAGISQRREGDAVAIQYLEQGEQIAIPVLPVRQALFQRWRAVLDHLSLCQRVDAWRRQNPQELEYYFMAADAAQDTNDFATTESILQQARICDPSQGGTALVRFYVGRDRLGAARRVAEQMVREDPDTMRHWGLLAEVNYRQERVEDALAALEEGLKREPTRLSLVRQNVGILLAQERFDEAIASARKLVKAESLPPQVGLLTGAFYRARRFEEAVGVLDEQLLKAPKDRVWRMMKAGALRRMGRREDARQLLVALYDDEPGNFRVARSLVRVLIQLDRMDDALKVMRELTTHSGDRPDLLDAIAAILIEQGALDEAERLLKVSSTRFPRHLPFWMQQAEIYRRRKDAENEARVYQSILEKFQASRWAAFAIPALVRLKLTEPMEKALNTWREAEPVNVEPWWAAFRAAREMKNTSIALHVLTRIEARRGSQASIHSARANVQQENWQMDEAISEMRKAIELQPNNPQYYESLLNIMVKAGDFDEFDSLMSRLEHLLGDRRYHQYRNFFFNINCHPTWTAEQIWRFYHDWYERAIKHEVPPAKPFTNTRDPERRLRIGYVSPDFRGHAVAYFSEPLLIEHDREQFEIWAFAHLETGEDDYSARFKSYVHHWVDITHMSDDEMERYIREAGIDMLIDLAGHTSNNRLSVFLRRPAPIQIGWIIGAGQTTGLPEIEYFLSTGGCLPDDFNKYAAEKEIISLPQEGGPYKPPEHVLDPVPLPYIKNGFVTFGVLARPLRTNRNVMATWAEILKRVPSAKLRFDHIPYADIGIQKGISKQFEAYGIDSDRLIFLNTRPHWKVYQEIDIQLDPFPAGSGTTSTEGLYMERLVVTLRSRPPMGWGSDMQIRAMKLQDHCSANTVEEYIDKAVSLATDMDKVIQLCYGLRERMHESWLMDYSAYGREVARIYRDIWRKYCGKP